MTVEIRTEPPLAWVLVDNPPVNALSLEVRQGLLAAAKQLDGDETVKAVVLICKGRTFIAGADIREFGKPPVEPHLPDVIARIERAAKPWIAAVHGSALGGGCEVALGCHYRLADPQAKFGLPEVHLGLIPGAGGTVRLPRIVGVEAAVEMVTSGKPVGAAQALATGLVDTIAEGGELADFARDFALEKADAPMPEAVSRRSVPGKIASDYWDTTLAAIEKKARGQYSPVEAALAIRDGVELPQDEAFKKERQRFIALKESEQSAALRHVFFAERQTAKIAELEGVEAAPIKSAGVIGGGTMGAGIAAAMLLSGLSVTMVERDEDAAKAGLERVHGILAASRKRGLIDDDKLARLKDAFSAETDYATLSGADLVVEAVFEDMDVKKQVFAALDQATKADAILATNTSYLDVNQIAAAVADPSRVLGLHFFSPAHVMKLVEIVKTDTAAPPTLATGFALAKKLRKIPVLAGICDGFIGNRILSAYRKQCDYMLEDGATPRQIDQALKAFGMPMGVFEMQDMAGLDIGWATRKRLASTRDPNERYVKIADRLCELGRFGQKTGSGWYQYPDGARQGQDDPLVQQIIDEERAANNITPIEFTEADIQQRILSTMASEGKKILDEGIARSAADIDMVMILGYGFPRWRGGPMFASGITD